MNLLTVKVSAMAGSRVEDAALAMRNLADRTGTFVECDFNEVVLRMRPGGSPEGLVTEYRNVVSTDRTCKMAFG